MTNRTINNDGDIIENEQESSHVKGVCVPAWSNLLVATTPLIATTEMGDFN